MSKKIKLQDLTQTDAKEEKGVPTTLDQIWGDTGLSKYGTNNFEEYKNYLNSLNRTDIHAHAVKIGILPIDNHEILIARLQREFMRHSSSFITPKKTKGKKQKNSKDILRILSEGR